MMVDENEKKLKSILFQVQMIPAIYFLLLFINNILYINNGVSSLTIAISRVALFVPFVYFVYYLFLGTRFLRYFGTNDNKQQSVYMFGMLSGLLYFFHFIPFILGCLITINILCIILQIKNKLPLATTILVLINTILVLLMLFINVK